MALKYQALNGITISKTTTLEGYDINSTNSFRFGSVPCKYIMLSDSSTQVKYGSTPSGTYAKQGACAIIPNNTTTAASSTTIGYSGGNYSIGSNLNEKDGFVGSGGNTFLICQCPSTYSRNSYSTLYAEIASGIFKIIFYNGSTKLLDTIEYEVAEKKVFHLQDDRYVKSTASSGHSYASYVYIRFPIPDDSIILGVQFIAKEITETQNLITPTLSSTNDGNCVFNFQNNQSDSITIVIDDVSYPIFPNTTRSITLNGTNDVLNTKSYYCKSFWKHDSEVGTIEFTPTAPATE